MGRPRKNNPLGLPPRTYAHHGQIWYVHRDGTWEPLGNDIDEAKRKANLYNSPGDTFGTMSYFLDLFLAHCDKRVASGGLSPRTRDDYKRDAEPLKKYFGKLYPNAVTPNVVQGYLDLGAEMNRKVRANREKACLSACISWMLRAKKPEEICGIQTNPCMRSSGVKRNKETKREVYVEDAWLNAVASIAPKNVRCYMMLIYRTLQRPEDVLYWNNKDNLIHKDGKRILRNDQGKTGTIVDIELDGELDAIVRELQGPVPHLTRPWLHTREGEPYTYDGIDTILRRYQAKARKDNPACAGMRSWGFQDLKGKGATDMWLAGVPIERIQLLCGHKDKQTTEIYIKCRWRETATANQVKIGT